VGVGHRIQNGGKEVNLPEGILCEKCQSQLLEFWNTENTVVTLICPKCEEEQFEDILNAPRRMSYGVYRKQTGICETCRRPMEGHEECEACGILTGPRHIYSLRKYRGKSLCPACVKQWKALEKDKSKKLRWEETNKIWRKLEKGSMEPRGRKKEKTNESAD